jgi:hypothetical protein
MASANHSSTSSVDERANEGQIRRKAIN